jgi:hypothetical protein
MIVGDKYESLDGTRKTAIRHVRNGTVVRTSDGVVRYPVELEIRARGPKVLALVSAADRNELVYAVGAPLTELRRIVGAIVADVQAELRAPPQPPAGELARLAALRGL